MTWSTSRRLSRAALSLAAAAALLVTSSPVPSHAAAVLAVPGSRQTTYGTPIAVARAGDALTFVNLDISFHNVVAFSATRPDGSAPWCRPMSDEFGEGACPLFWTPLIGRGEIAAVEGLELAVPGQTYTFFCSQHPGMTGELTIIDA